jgi:eukaryotic-like serine/threonine-protein kinase
VTARVIDRYLVHAPIASGGIATVYFGRLRGPHGFSRTVAIKKLHPQLAADPDLVASLLDEARLASKVRHPNVVPTLDVVSEGNEPLVVMEYIHGDSLIALIRAALKRSQRVPPAIAAAIVRDVLRGLHAAHEARDEAGVPLRIVHRDVSPQNVLVGVDGVSRVVDFGVAKAVGRLQVTRSGEVKGKVPYMAPEQLMDGASVGPRADVYGAAVVLWETLTGKRLFRAENDAAIVLQVMTSAVDAPSRVVDGIPPALDAVVLRGLARDAGGRYESARDMADAIEQAIAPASSEEVSAWVKEMAGDTLAARAARVAELETLAEPATTPTATKRSLWWLLLAIPLVAAVAYAARARARAPAPAPASAPAPAPASAPAPAPASAPAPALVSASASAPASVAKPAVKKTPPPKPNCKPPYTIDAQGHKHWKADCL